VSFAPLVQEKVKTWLTYVDTKTISPSSGMANHVFGVNNIHDPDWTGGGHRPFFYNQFAALYQKYRVLGVKYTVTFRSHLSDANIQSQKQTHIGATDVYPYILNKEWRNEHVLFTEVADTGAGFDFTEAVDLNGLRESGNQMSGVQWKYGPNRSGSTISGYINPKNVLTDPDKYEQATSFGATPTHGCYLAVGAMSKDGGNSNDIRFDIRMKILVELTSPVDVDAS